MNIATVSSKRQITIPKSLLEAIGIYPLSKVVLEKENESLILRPHTKSIVEQTAGSLKKYVDPSKLGMSWKKVMEETKKATAKHVAEE